MFELAENSLQNNPELKKVIILRSLPRYEPASVDPLSIKEKLNQFGNTLYTNLWIEKGCPSNIIIEDQHLDCHGPLRDKRFGNPGSVGYDGKPWDGIHMRGRLAVTHYTNSIIRILSGTVRSAFNSYKSDYHQTCPQTNYQSRQPHNYRGADKYQNNRRDNYNHSHPSTSSEYTPHRQQSSYERYGYNVRVSNKFSSLNY